MSSYGNSNDSGIGFGQVLAGFCVVGIIAMFFCLGSLIEIVDAGEFVVHQSLRTGELTVWTEPGPYGQWFGTVTHYKRSSQYWFSAFKDQGKDLDQSIKVRFNDGGEAHISGSVRYDMPGVVDQLLKLHRKFGSQTAIDQEMIRVVTEKAVYMTGPLMSSKESYAERRNELISLIQEQATKGVYETIVTEVETLDPLTNVRKQTQVTKIVRSDNGLPKVREESPCAEYGIRLSNFSINGINYNDIVEGQIKTQQQALMDVQTAMANARKAEQDCITTERKGQANAATAKWEQEVEKARALVKAEQEKSIAVTAATKEKDVAKLQAEQKMVVAELALKAAEFTKKEQIALGEGNSRRRELEMAADGALDKKLETYRAVNAKYAEEFGKQRWVPEVQMGGAVAGGNSAAGMIDLLSVKAAKELALDLNMATAAKKAATAVAAQVQQ